MAGHLRRRLPFLSFFFSLCPLHLLHLLRFVHWLHQRFPIHREYSVISQNCTALQSCSSRDCGVTSLSVSGIAICRVCRLKTPDPLNPLLSTFLLPLNHSIRRSPKFQSTNAVKLFNTRYSEPFLVGTADLSAADARCALLSTVSLRHPLILLLYRSQLD